MGAAAWRVVIPAKRLDVAKARLRGAVPPDRHADLALAMLRDTVTAAARVAAVTVVTADPRIAATARACGASATPDPGGGLNRALEYAVRDVPGWRAALTGDLPALTPAVLADVLGLIATAGSRRHVPDAAGTGTVLLGAPPGVPLDPRFGGRSAAAHLASGAVAVPGDWPALRRDVDTPADLAAALALGPARHTRALLDDLGMTSPSMRAAAV